MSFGTLRFQSRSLAVSTVGALCVLVIHALLLLPFLLDLSAPAPRRPNNTGAGAIALASPVGTDMTVVFIDEPSPAEDAPAPVPSVLASPGGPRDLPLAIPSPDPSPTAASVSPDSDNNQNDSVAAETAEHARMYGRYVGQLQARIERAWLRPRSEVGGPQFSCRARIQQDPRGQIVDITLDHCNGTDRWQQSLLSAIRTASPLPAPPDASVYADVLWLSFVSGVFEDGSSAQGFEPESRPADNADASVLASFLDFARGSRTGLKSDDRETSKILHLTIVGSPANHFEVTQLPTEPRKMPESPEVQPPEPPPQ